MNHDEMLRKLGLNDVQFRDLLAKLNKLMLSLDTKQRDVVTSSLPTLSEAARSFGPGVSESDLEAFLEEAWPADGIAVSNVASTARE
jgi:hypothetical protein